MAKGMNKRKEVKKPKKETAAAKVTTVASKATASPVPAAKQKT